MSGNSPFDGAVCGFLVLRTVVGATWLEDSPQEFLDEARISGFRVAHEGDWR
jgi:hypothetical protein